jgi:hypothetical protein
VPDITASLLILKRYFLDVSILGSFTDNAIQLGYRGQPGEIVQQVVLGTRDITIAPSPLLQIPAQPKGSLGAIATLAAGAATNDLLLRWDAVARKHKVFLGRYEVVEQDVPLDAYVRGSYFFLPDTGIDTSSLQVLIEDPAGTLTASDQGKYRVAGFDDVILNASAGLVTLRTEQKGRVLVFYTKGGVPVGSTLGGLLPGEAGPRRDTTTTIALTSSTPATYLGVDMSHRWITEGGKTWLLLWEPGDNSPFEIDNSYTFSSTPPQDVSRISYSLVAKDPSAVVPTDLSFTSFPDENRFTVTPAAPPTRFADFYPFADPDGLIYGPARDSLQGALDVEMSVQFLSPVTDMVLESDIVPGSVQVSINGVPETRYEVDSVSGKLTLEVPVLPTDRIDVSWQKAEPGTTGGDILFAWRDRIPITDSITLALEAGIRWNANPWTYSQQPYAKSGTVIAAASVSGQTGNVSWSAQAAAAYTNPDTSGILRLFGMEGNGLAVDLSEENAYPASKPTDPALTQAKRGTLVYRNFRDYGALGAVTLLPITSTPTPDSLSGRMGPYDVAGDSESLSSADLVFEYTLSPGQWVGAQLAIAPGQDVDLSAARSVTIRLKGLDQTGSVGISLEFGAVSEDLDGSGVLRAEASSAQAGFDFTTPSGTVLKVGAGPKLEGNGILDSEDRNGNGILDREDPTRVVGLSVTAPSTSWTTTILTLTDDDRAMLQRTRAFRVVIRSAAGASGMILVDALSFDSSPFWPAVSAADRPSVTVWETPETLLNPAPAAGEDLASEWPQTYKRFHPGAEQNSVLAVSWAGTVAMPLVVKGFVPQGTGGIQYDTLVSYIRSPTAGLTCAFSLLDAAGKGIAWTISGITDAWHEVRVSRTANAVTVDGVSVGKPDRYDAGYGSLTQLTIQVTGSAPGTLYLDEIFCTDPQGSFGAAFTGSLSAEFPGTIVAAGKVPLLANVTAREDVALFSAGFSPLYGTPQAAEDLSSRTEAAADLLFTRTRVNVLLRETGGLCTSWGGHSITIPSGGSPVTATDSFALDSSGGFSREDKVHVTAGSFLDLAVDSAADASNDTALSMGMLTQTWNAAMSVTPVEALTLGTTLDLSQAVAGYPLPALWYGARWYREASLLAPWDGGQDLRRAGALDLKLGMPARPLGFSLEARAGAEASGYGAGLYTQQSTALLGAAVTTSLGPAEQPDLTASVSYTRELSLTTVPAAGPRFATEASELSRVLGMQDYLLTLVPFAEILADNEPATRQAWAGAGDASYKPTLGLSLQRGYGGRLVDLLLPSGVDLTLWQELKREGDATQTLIHLQPRVTGHSLNLFGELGAFPLLPGVRTDEYSLNIAASIDGPPGVPPVLTSLTIEGFAALTGTHDNELTLTDSLSRQQTTAVVVSNDLQLAYVWTTTPAGGVRLPLIPPDIASAAHFEHRESAGSTVTYQDTGSFHPFNVVVGHKTSLVFAEHGSVSAGLTFGVDAENLGSAGVMWRLAVRISLEGKLTF